jgi:DNA polymerase delta subunit 2
MTLLSIPTTTETRLYAEVTPGWQRFQSSLSHSNTQLPSSSTTKQQQHQQQQQHPYQRQYAHVYHQRLSMLGPRIAKRMLDASTVQTIGLNESTHHDDDPIASTTATGIIHHVSRILELPEDQLCSCVGTIVVEHDMTNLTSTATALDERSSNDPFHTTEGYDGTSYCSYYLEDESGRVALNFTTWWKNIATSTTISDPDVHALGGSTANTSNINKNDTPTDLCTGLVVGVVGVVGVDGIMNVQKVYSAATVQTIPKSMMNKLQASMCNSSVRVASTDSMSPRQQPHLLLLSGLDCGSPHASSLSRDMLISYLHGLFPHPDSKASAIVHVIVAGGLVYNHTTTVPTTTTTTSSSNVVPDDHHDHVTTTANGCRDLDVFCYHITQATGIPMSIIPGQNDPTTANWPQRPIHSSLIPISTETAACRSSSSSRNSDNNTSVFQLLNRCPNPYAATFSLSNHDHTTDSDILRPKRNVIGTDGTNVADWILQTKQNDPFGGKSRMNKHATNTELDALHATLAHQHLCPTGPNTVPTAPHIETDPMVMMTVPPSSSTEPPSLLPSTGDGNTSGVSVPTLYFAGNCTQFQTKLVMTQSDISPRPVPTTSDAMNDGDDVNSTENMIPNHVCRLVCIPKFIDTGIAVLVNLETLNVELLRF